MNTLPEFNKPAYYEFRVGSRISSESAAWFEGMEIAVDETAVPAQTLIKGYMEDHSALHGLTLVSVNQIGQKGNDTEKDA